MEDREVVAAIVTGDPAGLAEAYDRYAAPLYAYCCSMLREPADAADAVQDTFLIAAAKLRALRDPGKLRPWLYAVARNECLRRLRAANATSALDAAQDVPAPSVAPGREKDQVDLQELVRDAIDGLNPGDRDVIELSLGHELEGDDLADALGVSRNHAHALLSRARGQLERSLGALIVARTGRAACAGLDAVLTGWDGQLTALMRKRISRHIEQCQVCGERKRRELTPALFVGLAPLAALMPGFRDQLLRIAADRAPAGLAHRLAVANRAGPFGPAGFPRPLRPPGSWPWHRAQRHPHALLRRSHAMVASGATSVVAAGVIAVVVIGGGTHHGSAPPAGPDGGTTHGAAVSTGRPSPAHNGPSASGGSGGSGGSGLAPSASKSGGATAPGQPGASAPPGTASASAGSSPSAATSTAPASSSPSAAASPGTLTVSSGTLRLVSVNGTPTGSFTITAHGGPVSDYSITVGSALAGKLAVSPSSGSLASGGSATVTVTSTSLVSLDGQLTVNPGGHTVTVVVSVGL
jgi:RNA polymerase sigma factor (sigma-70 family)